jgi:hypothetical protein
LAGPKSIADKLDMLLERTVVLEQMQKIVCEHDDILRGPDKDDGMITDMQLVKSALRDIKNILVPIGVAFIISVAGFIFALITHTIQLVK